jgi:RNA polymerase sigma-70 factor, ECF subfamily
MPASDEQLMLAYAGGDAAAFEALYARHKGPLYRFVLRSVKGREVAEELFQEVWMRAIEARSRYTPRAKFSTWLFTIGRNLCLDAMRRDRHRRAESLDSVVGGEGDEDGRPLAEVVPGDHHGPERQALNVRLRPVLEAVIAKLPDEQREVFVLREYSGVPFKDIAELTGVSENTVKSRMRYALEALRRHLNAAGIDGDLADDDAARPRVQTGAR